MKLNSVISRFIIVFVLILGVATITAMAQVAPPQTITFALPAPPDAAALSDRNLKWIKTKNDFDQNKFATAELIDKEIENRIKAYAPETAIVTYDVPINYNRLSYTSYQTYLDFIPAIKGFDIVMPANPKPGALYNVKAHFWRYGDINIAVPGDTYKDQMNVYAIARAVEILKYRYPQAYQKLFVETRSFQQNTLPYALWRNKYSVMLFSFDESPDSIAGGLTANGTSVVGTDNQNEWSNVSLVSIHNTNIQGYKDYGSKPIYMSSSAEENYVRYLREGLVETLVHEMLHRYINYMYTYNELYNKLYNARNVSQLEAVNIAGEEAVVATTSLHYFLKKGGLQNGVYLYYGGIMGGNINRLITALSAESFSELIDPKKKNVIYKDRLRLDILD